MTRTREERMNIAEVIRQQIGGHRFAIMTGARDFIATETGLQFKLPNRAAKNKANLVSIALEDDDTYTVTFMRYRGLNVRDISKHHFIYWDDLQSLFTRETGLYTTL